MPREKKTWSPRARKGLSGSRDLSKGENAPALLLALPSPHAETVQLGGWGQMRRKPLGPPTVQLLGDTGSSLPDLSEDRRVS